MPRWQSDMQFNLLRAHDSCYLRNGKIGEAILYIGNSIPPKVSIGYYVDNVIDEVDSAYVRLGDSISVVAFDSDKGIFGDLVTESIVKKNWRLLCILIRIQILGKCIVAGANLPTMATGRENKPMPLKDLVIDKENTKILKSQSVDKNQLIRMSTPIESQIFYSMSYNAKDSRYSSLCSHAYVTRDTQCCTLDRGRNKNRFRILSQWWNASPINGKPGVSTIIIVETYQEDRPLWVWDILSVIPIMRMVWLI